MSSHNITFVAQPENTSIPVLVKCSCGVKPLPARNGTDAMRVARVHIITEKAKEAGDAITT